jgi:hypothetical protein
VTAAADALMGIFGFKRVDIKMEDDKLIQLAAKAAGIVLAHGRNVTDVHPSSVHYLGAPYWEPLTDDGDALRLAHALGMQLNLDECNDMNDVRTDIVSAAAAIGESMHD